jgi:hypothetical protein
MGGKGWKLRIMQERNREWVDRVINERCGSGVFEEMGFS